MQRRRAAAVVIAALVLLNVIWLGIAIYFQHAATTLPYDVRRSFTQSFGVSDQQLSRQFDYDRFTKLTKEPVELTSDYGYPIKGQLLHTPGPARGTVLINGYSLAVMPVGDVFLDRGLNVLTYYAQTQKTSYGYREKHDLEQLVRFARARDPTGAIGVMGSSAWGATALQHAAMNRAGGDVAFYVIEASFDDLPAVFRYHLGKDYGLPNLFFVEYASLVNYVRAGHFFGEVSPLESASAVRKPVLFIHGRGDAEVPYRMGEALYAAKPGAKLFLAHEGGHSMSERGRGMPPEIRKAFEMKVDELLTLAGVKSPD